MFKIICFRFLGICIAFIILLTSTPIELCASAVSDNHIRIDYSPIIEADGEQSNSTLEDVSMNETMDITPFGEEAFYSGETINDVSDDNILSSGTETRWGNVNWSISKNGNLHIEGSGDFGGNVVEAFKEYKTEIKTATVNLENATNLSVLFFELPNLTDVEISVKGNILPQYMNGTFSGCKSLTSIRIVDLDTSEVEQMGYLFDGCNALSSIDLSWLDTSSVTAMNGMFRDCCSLSRIDLSGFDTSSVTDMSEMFRDCCSLGSIDLKGFNTSSVTDMSYMFSRCTSLSYFDLSVLDTSAVEYTYYMFSDCIALKNINLQGNDMSSLIGMSYMFSGCKMLASVDLSGFDSPLSYMGGCFSGCERLTEIHTPKELDLWVDLPSGEGDWTDSIGNVYTILPMYQYKSLTLTRKLKSFHNISFKNCEGALNPNDDSYKEGRGLILVDATKPGFMFEYWYIKKNNKTEKISEIPSTSDKDFVIYAKWKAFSYKFSFSSNVSSIKDYYGGSQIPPINGSMKTQSISGGSGTALKSNAFKISGYVFKGWNTESDGSGKAYSNKEKVYFVEGNPSKITLFAQWEKATYAINYVGLTDEEISAWKLPTAYQVDSEKITFADYKDCIVRSGYTFKGWYKDKKYSEAFKSIKTKSTGNKTVYVKMTANKYTVAMYRNEASITDFGGTKLKCSGSTKKQTLSYDKKAKLSKSEFKVKGYNFVGWNTDPNGNGQSYSDAEEVLNLTTDSGDTIKLYAQWEKATFDIEYVGITADEVKEFGLPLTYQIDSESIIFSDYSDSINRPGYRFKGWYSDKKLKNSIKKIGKGNTGNKKVYLKFKKLNDNFVMLRSIKEYDN